MKPYYEDGSVTIYHGDCRDVLPTLGIVDLVITDPPYGVQYESNFRRELFGPITGDDSLEAGRTGLCASVDRLRVGRHLYAFGLWNLRECKLRSVSELIWDKGRMSVGDLYKPWGNQHEHIQFGIKDNGSAPAKKWQQYTCLTNGRSAE